jgi:hypothetical protein
MCGVLFGKITDERQRFVVGCLGLIETLGLDLKCVV